MALTAISQPGAIAFARNPVIIQLQANNAGVPYDATGVGSKMTYVATDRFAVNATLTITYTEPDTTSEVVTFTAKASPSGTNEIPASGFSGTNTQYWEQVRSIVATHPRIAPYFDVATISEGGALKLRVRAKSTATGWAVAITNSASFSVSAEAAAASTLPANYKGLLQVFFENTYEAGNYELVAELEGIPAAQTGFMYFDISSVLGACVKQARTEPLVPVYGTNTISLAGNIRRYYVRYTEQYGTPIDNQEWQYSDVKLCMDGGVSQSVFADGDFFAGLDSSDSLLTWMPDGRQIAIGQPEYLAWYNYTTEQRSVRIEMQWYDIDNNAISTATRHLTAYAVEANEVALLPVEPSVLGLDVIPDAYKYRVRVVYYNDALAWEGLSQWRTYYINTKYTESTRNVQYLNAFGVPETWRCTGVWSKRLSVNRSVSSRPLQPGYNEYATDTFQYQRSFQNELTYRTGFITQAEAEALQELLISGEVYDVTDAGYIPLRVTTDTANVSETRQELYSYAFTTLPRLDALNYSKKKLQAIITGAWQEPDGSAWFDTMMIAWQI